MGILFFRLEEESPSTKIAGCESTTEKQKDEKPFKCDFCEKCFRLKSLLNKHLILHSDLRPYSCSECGRAFKMRNNLTKHMVMHLDDKPFSCQHCGKTFKRSSELSKHDRTVHQGKKYRVNKRFQCNSCPKAFTYQQALEDHQYVHTGIKNYQCGICGTTLYSNYNLIKHMNAHLDKQAQPGLSKKGSFQCHICGAAFSYSQSHRLHLRTIHGDAKPKCPICGKVVSSRKFLESHINTHTGEKPFCCEFCGRSFTSKSYLEVHVRGHTGEMPFKCTVCSKGFKQKSALTSHFKKNHPGETLTPA